MDWESFIRKNYAGGIGDPDVDAYDIMDVVASIHRCQQDGPDWQKCSILKVTDSVVIWVSGSRTSACIWPKGVHYSPSVAFDAGSSLNMADVGDTVVEVSHAQMETLLRAF